MRTGMHVINSEMQRKLTQPVSKKFRNLFRQGKFVALYMFVFFMQGHIWVVNSYFWEFGRRFSTSLTPDGMQTQCIA